MANLIQPHAQRNHHRQVQSLDGTARIAFDKVVERALPTKHTQNDFLGERPVLARKAEIRDRSKEHRSVGLPNLDAV